MENCGLAVKVVISFLRGQLINHDTPPSLQTTRSKPDRPLQTSMYSILPEMMDKKQGTRWVFHLTFRYGAELKWERLHRHLKMSVVLGRPAQQSPTSDR